MNFEDWRNDTEGRKRMSSIAADPSFQRAVLLLKLHYVPGKIPSQKPAGMSAIELVCWNHAYLEGAQHALAMLEGLHTLAPRNPEEDSKPKRGGKTPTPAPEWGRPLPNPTFP